MSTPAAELRRYLAACGVILVTALAVGFVALAHGPTWSPPGEVLSALVGRGDKVLVITQWRLPQVVAALVLGAALGLAGAVFQNLTRNPLGSPDIIGLDAGAWTGALLVLTLGVGIGATGQVSSAAVAVGAVAAGVATALTVYLLSRRQGFSGLRLVVIGIAVNAMLTAFNQWVVMRAELDVAIAATAWSAGSLNGFGWDDVVMPCAVVGLLALGLGLASRTMHQAALGDEVAVTTGVRLGAHRLVLVLLGVGCTATVTAVAGPIVFVALAAPQIGRRLTRSAGVPLLAAGVTGALVLVASDLLAQTLTRPVPLPVGVVTTAVGGLYLTWLLVKEVKR
ncbi:iron chelate uptake ABC transporter family permease subunit [Nocardioides sp. Y6]|uniref:Iron chelate uptake ABC transporter family permease subunit n=1 Tax=Nocardioides malaquae TaxID=2773426 RepID=A0ABR9RW51_9ACTN|nr:iron chelate uptake ABC transporter family permease subunit [Nocardioides malaquae]MBE7325823.1 iron chelate uptake ABC transporter family permease subunit [Nocardioides malaquae]